MIHERSVSQSGLGPIAMTGLALVAYFIVIGGTPFGEVSTTLKIFNALIGGAVLLYYITGAPRRADRVDAAFLVAAVAFGIAGLFSGHLRQSLDAVLGALVWAGVAFAARDQARRPQVVKAIPVVLMALSAAVTVTTVLRWAPVLSTWWSATGILAPPLDLDYPAQPWGHWHDLALLNLALYPAWWAGRPALMRRIVACVIGLLVTLIAILDGSRNVWLAAAIATIVTAWVAAASPRLSINLKGAGLAIGLAAVFLVVMWTTGTLTSVLSRVLDLAPLEMRTALWGASLNAWMAAPITGAGPGSFPWVLQGTGYFDVNSLAPRHPDSLILQLLAEAGVLGVVAMATVAYAVAPRILRSRRLPAIWALTLLSVAGLGANPSDFGFFIALAIAWLALAAPNDGQLNSSGLVPHRPVRIALVLCVAVVAASQLTTLLASAAYDRARGLVATSDYAKALAALDSATALDPSLALYRRQRGILNLVMDKPKDAIADLTAATSLNPADDLAWRSLAMGFRLQDERLRARAAIDRAIGVQRSDPTNLLLKASWFAADGHGEDAAAILAEVVQAWPAIIAAPGWTNVVPVGMPTIEIVKRAAFRWQSGLPAPEPQNGQGVWLALFLGDQDLLDAALEAGDGSSPSLQAMTIATFTCDPTADELLAAAPADDRRTFLYWLLRVRASAISGALDPNAVRVVRIWGGGSLSPESAETHMSPFDENNANRFNADIWGYRRFPIDWPPPPDLLPSPWAGTVRWLVDPTGATTSAGMSKLPLCLSLTADLLRTGFETSE